MLWAEAVYVWPRLRVDSSEASRNWQATADVTLATIVGTIVVLALTVGLLAVQMLSPYGWRATRMLVNRWFYAANAAVIIGGVVMPVWVAANPSPVWTQLSFLGFGWSMLLIVFVGAAVVMRMSPHGLVAAVVARARTTSERVLRRRPVLEAEIEVLVELFGSPVLPDSCRQPLADAIVHARTTGRRAGDDDFTSHLEALTTASEQLTSSTQVAVVVGLLRQLAEDDAEFGVRHTTGQTIRRIAADARLSGKRDVATRALDALAHLNIQWAVRLLPVHHLTPPERSEGIVTYGAEAGGTNESSYMVEETVAFLRGHLAAPDPLSEGWPDGWQGTAAYEEDLRRIASLPIALYDYRRYVATDAAEQAVAEARTSGRDSLVAELLGHAMYSAYRAGFDRRALTTGRRLIEAAADAVERGEYSAADSYLDVLRERLPTMGYLHSAASTVAHGHRDAVVLAGLIAHTGPLLAASVQNEAYDLASEFVDTIALSASHHEDLLEERGWRARLAATDWPTEPLPEVVVAAAENRLTRRQDPIHLSAILVLVLWANAVRTGGRDRLRDVVSATLVEYLDLTASFEHPTLATFGRLCQAAVDWADGRGEARLPATDQPSAPTFTVVDRRYHGLTVEGETAVLVVESDGSHRLLRAEDGRTSQVFTWGYTGGGPHAFARALVDDGMRDALRCPYCLGAAPAAGGLVTCAGCDDTGRRADPSTAVSLIVNQIVQHLPGLPGTEPAWPHVEWTVSHEQLLAHVTGQKPLS